MSVFVLCQSVLLPLIRVEDDGKAFLWSGITILFLACLAMAINIVAEAPSTAIQEKT